MLSWSEDLLFAWEPALKCHGMHLVFLNGSGGSGKNFIKNLVVSQKILISKRGCIMGWIHFLKGNYRKFLEKIENCVIAV